MAQQGSNQVASHNQVASGKPGDNKPCSTSMEYQLKRYLLLLATGGDGDVRGGAQPARGVWQEDTQDGHVAGDPILPDTHYRRYLAFYYCNATAFATSLVACLLLLLLDEENMVWATVVRAVMVLNLFGLMGAYAAGSCRDAFTTIYASLLVTSVFAYVTHVFLTYSFRWVREYQLKTTGGKDPEKQQVKGANANTNKREEEHEVLMLLATFVVTITYVAGLGPPGGFWGSTQDGHRVSDPIMQDHNSGRYQAFFVCNTTAFVASLLIIMLLMDNSGGASIKTL